MAYLADTNILLRWLEPGTLMCEQAQTAVRTLRLAGETVFITPQNLIEFWNGATRPADRNGLGLTPAEADAEAHQLERFFPLLPETVEIYPEWRRLVVAHNVSGVQVHDTRLAAVMQVHGVSHLLTFNGRDFTRFPGITVVHPSDVTPFTPASDVSTGDTPENGKTPENNDEAAA